MVTQNREIDPRLTERGVQVIDGKPDTSGHIWRLIKARWFNQAESGGRHHIYVETINEDGIGVSGVPFEVIWPTGNTVSTSNGKHGFDAANFPMSPSRNEFSLLMKDGDFVRGLGIGEMTPSGYNTGIHTATLLVFARQRANGTTTPPPTSPVSHIQLFINGALVFDNQN